MDCLSAVHTVRLLINASITVHELGYTCICTRVTLLDVQTCKRKIRSQGARGGCEEEFQRWLWKIAVLCICIPALMQL